MAFTASVTKQLGDLLQEQQEPFVLELYLIDRGYRKNVMLSKRNRIFRRACRSEVLCRRRKIISRCSSAVKALFEILGVKRGSSRKSAEGTFSRKGQHRHGNLLDDDEVGAFFKSIHVCMGILMTNKIVENQSIQNLNVLD